jgi:hypothetical protein
VRSTPDSMALGLPKARACGWNACRTMLARVSMPGRSFRQRTRLIPEDDQIVPRRFAWLNDLMEVTEYADRRRTQLHHHHESA